MAVKTGDILTFRLTNPNMPSEIFEHRCHVVKVPDNNGIIVGLDSDDFVWAFTNDEIIDIDSTLSVTA